MKSLNTSIDMDAWIKKPVILISILWHYLNGLEYSGRKVWYSGLERTERGLQNIVRNDSPVGFSWLINCLMQGSLRISLAFLNLIVLSLKHANNNKEFEFSCQVDKNYPGDVVSIRNPGVFLSSGKCWERSPFTGIKLSQEDARHLFLSSKYRAGYAFNGKVYACTDCPDSSSHGAILSRNVTVLLRKSSVAFFKTTTLPSVLWLSRSAKKGPNFSKQTVIGSGRIISAQNVAGVWGVCWHGARLFYR